MSERDPELTRLLILELTRHLETLATRVPDMEAARRAVHALKGSAGLAGEKELAAAVERTERRIREGAIDAVREAAEIVRVAIARLAAGESAVVAEWPEPPGGLIPTRIDPLLRSHYVADVADRLGALDEILGLQGEPIEAATIAFRHVHTLKGAASAVGDEPMAWFCHGLEERLTRARTREDAALALQEIARWRAVLGGLLDDPDTALQTLRVAAARKRGSTAPLSARLSARPDGDESRGPSNEATIRVAAASVDRLLDGFESIGLVREQLGVRIEGGRAKAQSLRKLRGQLGEALRLIGPPRPWGAPAAALRRIEATTTKLGEIADDLDGAVAMLRAHDLVLRESVTDAKRNLSAMRLTTLGRVFARLTTAIESEARRIDRAVIVRVKRADETIDRRLAEQLVDPCLQLVRNAVAHGIESPAERIAAGKPATGTISISGRRAQNRLSIFIQDDGAGVDGADVRRRAVLAGVVAPEMADAADDDTLLSLLFLPGFSTHEGISLLAGRGIGLDITRSTVQRLGGSIRLSSRLGEGFSARIDVPVESGLARVLWVEAAGETYAMPASPIRVVHIHDDGADRPPHLAACLESCAAPKPAYALEIEVFGDDDRSQVLPLGVDAVGTTEEVLVRPLSPLVAGIGPFAGAVVRGDGSLRLAIDVDALAPRIRSLLRSDGRPSERPARPSSPSGSRM